MKKVLLGIAGGFGLALACGLAGLTHLSATLFTLTVFCATQAILFYLAVWCFGFVWSLPDKIAAWVEFSDSNAVGEKRKAAP